MCAFVTLPAENRQTTRLRFSSYLPPQMLLPKGIRIAAFDKKREEPTRFMLPLLDGAGLRDTTDAT
jgi:hypothetical protein